MTVPAGYDTRGWDVVSYPAGTVRVMTAHDRPIPVPARITLALDFIGAEGPWVDEALGGAEPMVDRWERGELVPTDEQLVRLAELTGQPVGWFFRPVDDLFPQRVFVCERGRRGDNGLTILSSTVDWDGVLHIKQETPDRPPYRQRRQPAPQPAQRGVHRPRESPDTPGCCAECGLPVGRPNWRHR